MDDEALEILMQKIGGYCAVLGAALITAASIGFGGLTFANDAETVLQQLAQWPAWYWPAVHLAFAAGSVLWIGSFIALNSSFREPMARLLGSLGVVSMVLGAALHVIDAFISASALPALASQWAGAGTTERETIVRSTETLLMVLGGTWTGVVVLFHGVPFVFSGTSVTRSVRYPRPLHWTGTLAGFGSILTGTLMLVAPRSVPPALYFFFAAVSVVWMVGVGLVLKRPPQPVRRAQELALSS
ncbi:MAG TPA: hypothetical protein VJ717_11520 [Gemmatimonadaceae bacterium]|nr:hypothetical protein [Gemmatimonadaceae bacterium]